MLGGGSAGQKAAERHKTYTRLALALWARILQRARDATMGMQRGNADLVFLAVHLSACFISPTYSLYS